MPTRIKPTRQMRPFKDLIVDGQKDRESKEKANRTPSVYLFGRPHDWSGEEKTLALAPFFKNKEITTLFAPIPSRSNAKIAEVSEFKESNKESKPSSKKSFVLRGGVEADGVVLTEKGQACIIKSADCPTIVAFTLSSEGRKCVVAHASRDSLIDSHYIRGFGKSRKNRSVVDSVMDQFSPTEREELYVYVTVGIGARHFSHSINHSTCGTQNRELMEFIHEQFGSHCYHGPRSDGRISLGEIIRAQFEPYRDTSCIMILSDRGDTHEDSLAGQGTGYRWWSHRRGDKARNAVIVAF
jgi:hypothetical protein